ncbi:FecCD family ABC transporter permease [Thalassolituus sp. UBA3500]|uniref:FecCD family ABC transporter permease n=1 Tax=Thalassolituus sp. UBA3500 TaxID=1947664 RepID=UPI00263A461E|nr:iron ABC transporter permease [Thalassolituus sp. UBA3500]|tara:strand:- start:12669 stop:13697 length:1029 start_codon:yes stop_codon:yes gene_type:complete
MKIPYAFAVVLAFSVLCLSVMGAAAQGSFDLSFLNVLHGMFICPWADQCQLSLIEQQILTDIRLPRILMALLAGAGLSVTGAILQSVTRNPLADPYLFGISSGAALGAVLAMSAFSGMLAATGLSVVLNVTTGALAGGALSVFLMLTLAGKSAIQVEKLLLSGVAVSFMLSAFTSLVIYYSTPETAATLLFWLMGSFSGSNWADLMLPFLAVTLGSGLFFIFSRWLVVMQLGEESAATLGVPVHKLRLGMLLVCSAITAILVAEVGGIGFVGLMIPHIVRLLVGGQLHRVLLMSLLIGATFMIWVDVLAHSLLQDQVLPVGIVTSALGSLFFFIILKQRQSR